jgi:hypothetical protein
MAAVHANTDLEGRTSIDSRNEIEIANEKSAGYRMTEAEVPLEQRKEEARVL